MSTECQPLEDIAPLPCDGCGLTFPLRQAEGDCSKCMKLALHELGSPDYNELRKWQQCLQCGITRRNMSFAQPGQAQTCGSAACVEKGSSQQESQVSGPLGPSSVVNQPASSQRRPGQPVSLNEQAQMRVAALRGRIQGRQNRTGVEFGTGNTTGSLLHHEHGGGEPGEAKLIVGWQARSNHNGKIDGDLGGQVKKYAMSRFMPDIKAEIVETINIEWVKSRKHPLLPEEVSFRWSGNRTLDPHTAALTAQEFYNHYNTPSESNAALKVDQIPTFFKSNVKKQKGPMIFFDMYIDWKAWNTRVNPDAAKKKRGRNDSVASIPSSKASKQPRMSSGMESMASLFSPNARASASRQSAQNADYVTLRKFVCFADVVAGSSEILDVHKTVSGLLKSTPFARGAMKLAFDLHLEDGSQLVAKRFFRVTSSDMDDDQLGAVDPDVQKEAIENEAHRLAEGQWFLKEFYTLCSTQAKVSVDKAIQFSSAFVGEETDSSESSFASGLREGPSSLNKVYWLVEPKRPSTVTKFSGTLSHQMNRKDLQSLTIAAFAHFVYLKSKATRVFADIQGTTTNVKGKDTMVLFDVMTHSPAGDTGIGDFGPDGIASFLDDHRCGSICQGLGLHRQVPQAAGDSGSECSSSLSGEEEEELEDNGDRKSVV